MSDGSAAVKSGGAGSLASLDYAILQQCIHCGLCLPSCPTFNETGRERNSPRGRIALMRAIADGELAFSRGFAEEMSYCVGCLACTSACPAGVDYAHLLETARAEAERRGVTKTHSREFIRWFTLRFLFVYPRVMRAAGRLLWLAQISGLQALARRWKLTAVLPRRIRELEPLTPQIQPRFSDTLISEVETARGERRFRVALLTGCVADLVLPEINRATVDVLVENGCEVFTPRNQHCCGSLHAHNGDLDTARRLARAQIDGLDPFSVDALVSNAGGCGSHLKHYDRLLADDPDYAAKAVEWSRKTKDISEWLVEIGFRPPRANAGRHRVVLTYHESCHLCHGQKISAQPRALLNALPGAELRECAEATWCCGSAGVYNITQPSTAGWLQRRKIAQLRATDAEIVATANPGCHLQIQNGLRANDATSGVRVAHPVVLLAEAYRAENEGGTGTRWN